MPQPPEGSEEAPQEAPQEAHGAPEDSQAPGGVGEGALEESWSPWGPQTWSSYDPSEILIDDLQLFRVSRSISHGLKLAGNDLELFSANHDNVNSVLWFYTVL